jgi:polar amino acid transport system substrate-binding protein
MVVVLLCALAVVASACSDTKDAATASFTPVTDGVLTVAADLPAPGFWDGETPAELDGGFERALAQELATAFGLELRVVDVAFQRIVTGDLGGADLALAQIDITDERDAVLDYSRPYLTVDAGVLAPAGAELRDLFDARRLRWVTLAGSTEEDLLADVVRPVEDVLLVENEIAAAAAVVAGDADAALVDAPSAVLLASEDPAIEAIARFATGAHYGIAVAPRGSGPNRNLDAVDVVLRRLEANGTLADLVDDLADALGGDPSDLPVIRAR